MLDKLLSAGWYVMTNGTLLFAFFSFYIGHIQEKNSSYTAMPTARHKKILSTSWNVQFVVFNTSEKLNNNLANA
jgi:hypothetical protein